AVKAFKELDIQTNVTLIFNVNQALFAAPAGATYVTPFLVRLDRIGQDGIALIHVNSDIVFLANLSKQISETSIRHPFHVIDAARNGAHIATIPYDVIEQLVNHPLTDQGIEKFLADWNKQK